MVMTKKGRQFFQEKIGVTPSVAAPRDTTDATGLHCILKVEILFIWWKLKSCSFDEYTAALGSCQPKTSAMFDNDELFQVMIPWHERLLFHECFYHHIS